MNPKSVSRALGIGLLLLLLGLPCGFTYRAIQQDKLNQSFFRAAEYHDLQGAVAALQAGADPNGMFSIYPNVPQPSFWERLCGLLTRIPEKQQLSEKSHFIWFGLDSPTLMEALLERGANPDVYAGGQTPLHHLARNSADAEDRVIMRQLLRYGANVNVRDAYGETPLMLVVRNGTEEMVHALIARGADVNLRNEGGKTALAMAKECEAISPHVIWRRIIRILQQADAKE